MSLLARRMRRAGLNAESIGYPSTRMTLDAACEHVRAQVNERVPSGDIDLVGHSMGGVIARRLCLSDTAPEVRRVVQIGAPNLGSPLADRLGPLWAVRSACGPAIEDLGAVQHRLPIDLRVSAIAGTRSIGRSGGILVGPSDGIVTVRSAWSGAAHRFTVAQFHTLLPLSSAVAHHVIAALTADRDPALTTPPHRGM